MWPKPGESFTLPRLSKRIWLQVTFECDKPSKCMCSSARRTCLARYWSVFSGSAPTWSTKFWRLDLAESSTTETQPSGEFQNVSCTFKNQSCELYNSVHRPIHSLIIRRDSRLAKGTSLIQYILSDGPCNIFLMVPDWLLYTDSVII